MSKDRQSDVESTVTSRKSEKLILCLAKDNKIRIIFIDEAHIIVNYML